MSRRCAVALAVLSLAACSDGNTDGGAPADAAADAAIGQVDATAAPDAAAPDAEEAPDAGPPEDAAEPDSGVVVPDEFPRISCADVSGACTQVTTGQVNDLLDALNDLEDNDTIILSSGTFMLDATLTVRGASGVKLLGQGMGVTTLDFSTQATQGNGVDVVADRFTIEHLGIFESVKDGLRIEDSTDVAIRFVEVSWATELDPTNGAYGIYPVRCTNVLLEDSRAFNASDAGLYVGQSINVIVRRNLARKNVAGLEIENVQYAEVYENTVEENAGGLLIFDLPGNPVIGRDVRIYDNVVRNNNTPNYAPTDTTVSNIPRGTGTFALASRRVEIANNVYENNGTTDIAILSGLAVETSSGAWELDLAEVRGSTLGLGLPSQDGLIWNFRTSDIWVHGNTHMGTGATPDNSSRDDRPLGFLLWAIYGPALTPVDDVLYDGIGEAVDPRVPANNTNMNHICVEGEVGATFASLDLVTLIQLVDMNLVPRLMDLYRPPSPFVPYNCTGFTGGPIAPVILPDF